MIYVLIFLSIAVLSVIELNLKGRAVRLNLASSELIVFGILVCLAGIRTIGFDYDNYEYLFNAIDFGNYVENTVEIGYAALTVAARFCGMTYHQYLFVIAFSAVGMKMIFIHKWSPNIYTSLLYYFAIGYIVNEIGQIRHGLAIAIVMMSFSDIFNDRPKSFFFKVFIAFLIHASAIVVLPAYFLSKHFRANGWLFVLLVPLSLFLVIDLKSILLMVVDYLPLTQLQAKVSYYVLSDELGVKLGFNTSLLLRLMFLALLYYYRHEGRRKYFFYDSLFILYYFGILLYIIFNSVADLAIRSSLYFKMLEVLIIPIVILSGKTKLEKNCLWLLMVFYALWSLYKIIYDPTFSSAYLPFKSIL